MPDLLIECWMSFDTRMKSILLPRMKVFGAEFSRLSWIMSMRSHVLMKCENDGSLLDICWFASIDNITLFPSFRMLDIKAWRSRRD